LVDNNIGVDPTLSSDEKREILKKKYVDKNGRLICCGHYMFKFSPTNADTDSFSRYVIFDQKPDDALEAIKKIKKGYTSKSNSSTSVNPETYHMISPYSSIDLVARVLSTDKLFGSDPTKNRILFLNAWKAAVEK